MKVQGEIKLWQLLTAVVLILLAFGYCVYQITFIRLNYQYAPAVVSKVYSYEDMHNKFLQNDAALQKQISDLKKQIEELKESNER